MTCTQSHSEKGEEIEWSHLSFRLTILGIMATMRTRFRCRLMTCTHSYNDKREEIEWWHLSFWLTLLGSIPTMGDKVQMLPDDLYTLTQWWKWGDWVITPVLLTHLIRQQGHYGDKVQMLLMTCTHSHSDKREETDHLSTFWLTLSGSMATMGTRFRCSVQRQPVIQNTTFIKCLILLLVILISVNNTHTCTHTYTHSFTTQPHI